MISSRRRRLAAALVLLGLAALMGWRQHRAALNDACISDGGIWTGSGCGRAPHAPILQRDLRRT